tara:strand:- start:16726 stop:17655 length:930 start_codon:yes stop_codon:yes gene_type:complete
MYSVIFPGQGSQIVGMAKEFYENYDYVKDFFLHSDEILKKKLSKIILEGSQQELDLTVNTQPAIFLASYSIFKVIEKQNKLNINKAKYYAGHSLGEYSALCCAGSISFEQTLNILNSRAIAMQNAVPSGEGGMIAVLGIDIKQMTEILDENAKKYSCYIANDNTLGQIAISGRTNALEKLQLDLKKKNIKFVKLSVSAPFHCPLMNKAAKEMEEKINTLDFKDPIIDIISNVTAEPVNRSLDIKKLLIQQIEKPVRWRESVINMISHGTKAFIEIGPGKVLSGLVKRIDRNIKLNQVNKLNDIDILIDD